MHIADIALRFAAVSQLVLLAVLLLRAHWRHPVGPLGALYLYGVIAYLLCPPVARDWHLGWLEVFFFVGCFGAAVYFWLFTRALFNDSFRFTPYHALPIIVVVGFALVQRYAADADAVFGPGGGAAKEIYGVIPQILSLSFVLLALAQAQIGRRDDLVEPRRRFRDLITGLSGVYIVIVVISEILLRGEGPVPILEMVNVTAILVLAFGFTLYSLSLRPGLFARAQPLHKTGGAAQPGEAPDTALLGALNKAMEEERIYHREGLGIAALAQHLGSQEYILRRLINTQLGHRNFNQFLNRYRVAEACLRLADPAEARLPILTIAMELGYRSLGPFNRAFKEQIGITPSEFRAGAIRSAQQAPK